MKINSNINIMKKSFKRYFYEVIDKIKICNNQINFDKI